MNKIFLLATGLLLLASCSKDRITGSGAVVSENRNVTGFTKVVTNGATNVHISQGANFSVQLRGYENLLPYLKTKLDNNALEIGYTGNVNIRNDNVEAWVTMPLLEGVSTNGSANADVKGGFTGADLRASISGSGSVTVEDGNTPLFSSSISGSGNVHAFGLTAQRAETSISGSGTTEVRAVSNLRVRISGSGVVYYKGQPALDSEISGSGKLVHKP